MVVEIMGRRIPAYDLLLIAIGPVVLGAIWLLLTRTRWGALVRAATQDREMVGALGVDQAKLFTSVFFVGSVLAGLGGALQIPREPANLELDLAIIADAFVVTVVGGLGSIGGAFLAAIIIGVAKAFCIGIGTVTWFGFEISFSKLTLVVEFLIMALVLVVRRDHALAAAGDANWEAIGKERLVLFESGSMPALGNPARAQFAQGAEPYRVSYSETLYALVRSGQALGLMPRLYTSSLRDPELAVVPLLKPRVERRVVLAYLPGPMRNVVAQELIAFLRDRLPQAGEATVRRVSKAQRAR
eukprot:gene49965-66925_t